MTSRRNFLTLVGAGAAASLLGCAPTARRDPPPTAIEDRLLVDTTGGLVLLHGEVIDALGPAATTADGQTIFTAQPVGADTELRILSARTGEVTRSVHLAGRWTPSTGGSFGDVVALLPPSYTSDTYPPAGRSGTSMMVVSGEQVHRLDLPGNYTPDAFARDATGLFVLDWLPSTSPEHYRVREVQLAGGEVALSGEGKVTWVRDFDPAAPNKPHGMGVQFLRLDAPSREVVNQMLARKAAGNSGAVRMPLGTAGSGRVRSGANGTGLPAARIDTSVDLASELGIDEARLKRAVERVRLSNGRVSGEADELEALLRPEPIESVSVAQALVELPRLLDPAARRMSGAFRPLGELYPKQALGAKDDDRGNR